MHISILACSLLFAMVKTSMLHSILTTLIRFVRAVGRETGSTLVMGSGAKESKSLREGKVAPLPHPIHFAIYIILCIFSMYIGK